MKILFLTPEYPHAKTGPSGGIGSSIKNLADGLIAAGHQVIILIYGQKKDAIFEEHGIFFYAVKNIKVKGLSWWLTRKKIEKIINKLCKEQQVDIVEAPDWTGITSYIQPKCPVIIRQHGSDTYFCHLDHRKVKFMNRYHEKRALREADGLLSVSAFTGKLTSELFRLEKGFTVIPNAVNIDFFNDILHLDSSPPQVLYFGSLVRKKGLLELPHIFNLLIERNPDAVLTLIGRDVADVVSGNPSTWNMMQTLFSEKAFKKVNYLGSVDYDHIKQHIQRATVCVFPSFAEALPVSWLEAMAMQKAIVASNIGWASEMITDGMEGFLVDPQNHVLYAKRIGEILDSPELRSTFGENARKKVVSKFAVSPIVQQNIHYYNSIVAK